MRGGWFGDSSQGPVRDPRAVRKIASRRRGSVRAAPRLTVWGLARRTSDWRVSASSLTVGSRPWRQDAPRAEMAHAVSRPVLDRQLQQVHGYPGALGFMALIGTGMYRFFRKTGWFD